MNNVPITNVERTEGDQLVAVHVNAIIPALKTTLTPKAELKKETGYRKWLKNFNEYVHINHSKEKKESLGFLAIIDNTLSTAMLRMAQVAIERGKPDILINISRASCGTYDFYKAKELIEIGRMAASKELNKITELQTQV